MHRSGFVSVVGRPNVGKSTLINKIIGRKISIVSFRPQTTRDVIKGVYNDEDSQIIFTDTPGFHKPEDKLGEVMNLNASNASDGSEVILMLVDAKNKSIDSDKYVIEKIKNLNVPIFLVVNKIDAITKKELLDLLLYYSKNELFAEIIPISAKNDDNVDHLISLIKQRLPEGPEYFPNDMISDHPQTFLIAETIREKALYLLEDEIPYSIGVYCEEIKETEKRFTIRAIILCNRDSQKGIIIGESGTMIAKITKQAQDDLKEQLKKNVRLELYVKSEKEWRNNARILKMLGYTIE